MGKPVKAQWATVPVQPKQNNTLLYVTMGVGTAVIIVCVVMLITKKHNKNKVHADNLMFNKDYLTWNDKLPFEGKYQNMKPVTINNFGNIEQIKLNFNLKPMLIPKSFCSTKIYQVNE